MTTKYTPLIVVLGLVAAGTAATWSHRPPGPSPVEKGGVLIHGQFLSPPFRIAFDDGRLAVNDRDIASITPIQQERLADLSTDTRHGLIRHATAAYRSIRPQAGASSALASALALLEESPLVEQAIPEGPDAIEVRFFNDPHPELLSFGPSGTSDFSVEAQERLLRDRGTMIANFLNEDRLVVLHEGVLVATEPGTASVSARDLETARRSPLTAQARRDAVARVIPDARVARSIADVMTAEIEVSP